MRDSWLDSRYVPTLVSADAPFHVVHVCKADSKQRIKYVPLEH